MRGKYMEWEEKRVQVFWQEMVQSRFHIQNRFRIIAVLISLKRKTD